MRKKVNLKKFHSSKAWEYILKIYAREFLFGRDYQIFAEKVQAEFELTPEQWDTILGEWEYKEEMITVS